MKTTFDVGGYEIIVGGLFVNTDPQACSSPADLSRVVPIQIVHHPLDEGGFRCVQCGISWSADPSQAAPPPPVCPRCPSDQTKVVRAETVFYAQLEHSHARAIASAILSAASKRA